MLYIAGDKHGWSAISFVIDYLTEHKKHFVNLGVLKQNEDIALEKMLPPIAEFVRKDSENLAIVSCGTGVGVEVGMNKFSGIRAVLATNPQIATWSVEKDKCNVLCFVGWQITRESVYEILDAWFSAAYDGSESRLKMIEAFDTWH